MNLIDWFLNLFRDPVSAAAFVADPDRELDQAGFGNLSAAQVQAVAATVAPAAVLQGGGDPVLGLQQAVANTHGIAFTPQRQTDVLSNNDTLSHNDTSLLSPETNVVNRAGEDQQQGVGNFDLDFGDITLGDKTTNTATDGGVVVGGDNAGDIDTTSVEGDGNVVGDDNVGNVTGDIETEDGSPVIIGDANDVDNETQQAGGDIIQDTEGPVINDVDMSGGNGGGAVGGDGGGLIGLGNDGGDAVGGTGGSGGGIVINDGGTVDASDDDVAVEDNDIVTTVEDNDTTVTQGGIDVF